MVYRLEELDSTKMVTIEDPERLREIGQRYNTTDILEQKKRLGPLAERHAEVIIGYDPKLLNELNYLESVMVSRSAERTDQKKGTKKGALKVEADAIRAGKYLLRQTITTAHTAIRTRPLAEGQTMSERSEETKTLMGRLDGLRGSLKHEATTLRTRLDAALTLIAEPALVARVAELQGSHDLRAELTAMAEKLPTVSQTKEQEKKRSIEETAALDVLDGLMYLNLKALVSAGRAHFTALGDSATASLFKLDVLHGSSKATSSSTATSSPESPTES